MFSLSTPLNHRNEDAEAICWLCGGRAEIDSRYAEVPLHRCQECGFLFDPLRQSEQLKELYDDEYFEQYPGGEAYETDEEQRRFEARLRLDWVCEYLTSGRLLEIGAAAGFFLDEARSRGFEVCGVEPAPQTASRARERFDLDIRTGFVEDVDLPAERFDAVCAWHVLEHIHDPRPALERLNSVLNPDGHFFLEIPNVDSVAAKRKGPEWFHLDPPNHVGFYSPENLRVLLADAGFELIDTYTVSELSYFRPKLALAPMALAMRLRATVDTRSLQSRPHPTKHALRRAVARKL